MKSLTIAAAVLLLAAAVHAQPAAPDPEAKPDPEFVALFSPAPDGSFDTAAWLPFAQLGQNFTISGKAPYGVLEGQVIRLRVCRPNNTCTFRMSVLMRSNRPVDPDRLVFRYLLVGPDGSRAEGYAEADTAADLFRYFHRSEGPKGKTWVRLAPDNPAAAAEAQFVTQTWGYVSQQIP